MRRKDIIANLGLTVLTFGSTGCYSEATSDTPDQANLIVAASCAAIGAIVLIVFWWLDRKAPQSDIAFGVPQSRPGLRRGPFQRERRLRSHGIAAVSRRSRSSAWVGGSTNPWPLRVVLAGFGLAAGIVFFVL